MKRLLLLFIIPIYTFGQNTTYNAGARSAALAHSSVSLDDVWSVFHNQAGIAFAEKFQIASSYQNRYFLKELVIGNVAAVVPMKTGTLGLQLEYFGFELYNRSKLGLCYSKRFGKRMSVGLSINYELFYVEKGSNNRGLPTIEAGMIYKPLRTVQLGLHFYNPTNASLNQETEDNLPVIVRFGAQKKFGSKTVLLIEVKKQENLPERFSSGLEYNFSENFSLRTGLGTSPFVSSWGVGINIAPFTLDLAYEYTLRLGNSGTIGLSYFL